MTPLKPYIIVNRLVVTKNGNPIYDERYHVGVNIIRGKNSSGKSTIADFLFYGLGGDLSQWKEEAKSCDYTYIEVQLNGKNFTFKREISTQSKRGMDIFEGTLEQAQKSSISGWLKYPYQATDNKESYYQAIFKELGLPISKADDSTSITLHQLLRLMYVDQITSLDRLFKFDKFDSASKRKAIGELMLGISDFELYKHRLQAQKHTSLLDLRIKEIKFIHEFLGADIQTIAQIEEDIENETIEIKNLEAILNNEKNITTNDNEIISKLRIENIKLRNEIGALLEQESTLNFEIEDSIKFIQSLNYRIAAITESATAIHALSDIGFHYCPSCFQEVEQKKIGCCLCGSINDEKNKNEPTFKIRKEIEFQIQESTRIFGKKRIELTEAKLHINQKKVILDTMSRQLHELEQPQSKISIENKRTIIEIGSKTQKIIDLNQSKTKFSKLNELYISRETLQFELNTLNDLISKKEATIENEIKRKKRDISNFTKEILKADNSHEEIFLNGKNVDFDFTEDRVSIDDRAIFSASSMVYLKNAFRLALLEAACIDQTYLYPRFLLMDNIEDKGMEPDRSHIFQKEIIRVSEKIEIPHQIIFTTSMISPDLDNTKYCIGEKYFDQNKSLKFSPKIEKPVSDLDS